MPKTITADEYELLLEENCKAIREYISLLERRGDGMSLNTLRIVSRLIESESKLKFVERDLKEELERRQNAFAPQADDPAICRAQELPSRIARMDAIPGEFSLNQRRALGARWN